MADMRRRGPEPPPGPPQIQLKPGMAQGLLRELAPLLAEEGIDVDDIDVPDTETLQRALNRAMERHNMSLFTPVGQARELAAVTLRLAAEAIADGDTRLAEFQHCLDLAVPHAHDAFVAVNGNEYPIAPTSLSGSNQRLGGRYPDARPSKNHAAMCRANQVRHLLCAQTLENQTGDMHSNVS